MRKFIPVTADHLNGVILWGDHHPLSCSRRSLLILATPGGAGGSSLQPQETPILALLIHKGRSTRVSDEYQNGPGGKNQEKPAGFEKKKSGPPPASAARKVNSVGAKRSA